MSATGAVPLPSSCILLTKVIPAQLPLLIRTLRPLSLKQFYYLLRQRVQAIIGISTQSLASDFAWHADIGFSKALNNVQPRLIDGVSWRFINQDRTLAEVIGSSWRPDASRLWCYNLHYFDFLKDEDVASGLQEELALKLIDSWCKSNPPGTADAWDPYPISLRIVNWIKYFQRVELRGGEIPQRMLESLGQQVNTLEVTIEHHLRANHLFKNAVAMFFAGMFFVGRDAERWRKKGLDLLGTEVQTQFLKDGGHVERTPTYHAICLEDCLDCLNLVQARPVGITHALYGRLSETVLKGLGYLCAITLPDGSLAGFSDTAPGIAASTEQLIDYAKRLDVNCQSRTSEQTELIELKDSGYYGYRKGDEYLLLDCGPMGVSYQPGHAHCDLLSFEWILKGQKVITDTGVFNYEVSPEREYCRSTAAHNTVMIDDQEQGEIWSAFRLGRRPDEYHAAVSLDSNGSCHLIGEHNAYRYLSGGVIHKRQISRTFFNILKVNDELTGGGRHKAVTRFHFASKFYLVQDEKGLFLCAEDAVKILRINVSKNLRIRITKADCFPAFSCREEISVLEMEWQGQLPATWECRFEII